MFDYTNNIFLFYIITFLFWNIKLWQREMFYFTLLCFYFVTVWYFWTKGVSVCNRAKETTIFVSSNNITIKPFSIYCIIINYSYIEAIYIFHFVLIDIDECASHPCMNGGSCDDHLAGFTCRCVVGYSGPTCSTGTV